MVVNRAVLAAAEPQKRRWLRVVRGKGHALDRPIQGVEWKFINVCTSSDSFKRSELD